MLFHIQHEFCPTSKKEAQARFHEAGALPAAGVEMRGRRHSAAGRKGFMFAETDDVSAISRWTHQWTDLITFCVTPVLTDGQQLEVLKS